MAQDIIDIVPEHFMSRFLLTQKPIETLQNTDGIFTATDAEELINLKPAPFWGKSKLDVPSSSTIPAQWHATLFKVDVHSPSFAVTGQNILWQLEDITELPYKSAGYSDYFYKKAGKFFLLTQLKKSRKIKEAALIAHRTGFNYFHVIFEAVPKIYWLNRLDPEQKIPVILDSRVNPNLKELLAGLNDGREIIYLNMLEKAHIETLHVFSSPTYLPDDKKFNIKNAAISKNYIRPIKETLSINLRHKKPIELLFVSRRDYAAAHLAQGIHIRDIDNYNEIEAALLEKGATIFYPEKHNWIEQKSVFSAAKKIVMVSGSATSSLIYCRPGARALLLCKNQGVNPGLFFPLFEELNIQHGWVLGKSSDAANPHSNFSIDMNDFSRGLDWLYENSNECDGHIP